MGFWQGANNAGLELSESVDYAAGVSAGCSAATAAMLNRCDEAVEVFKELSSQNPGNIHWQNLKPGSAKPLLPHMKIYREGLKMVLTESDMEKVPNKRLEFLMAKFPGFLPSSVGTLTAFTIYGLEKHLTGALHPTWTRKLGFRPIIIGHQDIADIADLIEAILASSCVPPVLPGDGYMGHRVPDGGIIDNVPAFLADGRPGLKGR